MSDSIAQAAEEMAKEAHDLIATLNADQARQVFLPRHDEVEWRRWYYTPTPRRGLSLLHMNARQQQYVRRLLAAGLSEAGYNCACMIIGLESVIDRWQGFRDRNYGALPDTRHRDPNNYFVAVWGTPGSVEGWGWRIGGHHVSLHFTVRPDFVSPTPAFFGAEPAYVSMPGGIYLRPLAAEEDAAKKLLGALDARQRELAVIAPAAPIDIMQSNRSRVEVNVVPSPEAFGVEVTDRLRGELGITNEIDDMLRYTLVPKGLPYTSMTQLQRELFVELIHVYIDRMREPIASQFTPLINDRLDSMTFAWAGSQDRNSPLRLADDRNPFYYRIQGERLLIEYDNAPNEVNHAHSAWRDPQGDFGGDMLAEHYNTYHHSEALQY